MPRRSRTMSPARPRRMRNAECGRPDDHGGDRAESHAGAVFVVRRPADRPPIAGRRRALPAKSRRVVVQMKPDAGGWRRPSGCRRARRHHGAPPFSPRMHEAWRKSRYPLAEAAALRRLSHVAGAAAGRVVRPRIFCSMVILLEGPQEHHGHDSGRLPAGQVALWGRQQPIPRAGLQVAGLPRYRIGQGA